MACIFVRLSSAVLLVGVGAAAAGSAGCVIETGGDNGGSAGSTTTTSTAGAAGAGGSTTTTTTDTSTTTTTDTNTTTTTDTSTTTTTTIMCNSGADCPDPGNECVANTCAEGVCGTQPKAAGTVCGAEGSMLCDGAGNCSGTVQVTATSPADGGGVSADSPIAITFSTGMDPASLTAQTVAGACSGSIQVSLDGFASCIAFSAASASMNADGTVATLTPAPGLLVNRNYQILVTTAAKSVAGAPISVEFVTATGFATKSPDLCAGSVVISQVFGGGGSAAGAPNADYVELHNRGTTDVNVAGWSIQYAPAGGSTWNAVVPLTGTIAAGAYYLVQVQAAQAGGSALPAPDVSGTDFDLDPAAGKVALVSNAVALSGACPAAVEIMDFVGYGAADCAAGEGAAPSPSSSSAVMRVSNGCGSVLDNGLDFANGAPGPRNGSNVQACECADMNESDGALEAGYCDVQFPLSLSVNAGGDTGLIYGRLYAMGVTPGPGPNVRAQLGYGPATANPEYEPAWTWVNATFNQSYNNDDEYQASFTAPAAGSYNYVYRFSLDGGVTWTTCDSNSTPDFGSGSNAGETFDLANECVLMSQ